MKDWYEKSFGEDYLLVYKHRDVQGARKETKQMVSWLDLPQGARVLDLCCGMGRHSMALADAGYQVTGVDLSDVLLREARASDPSDHVNWIHGDMREVPLDLEFDAVVNLFTSFGYFREDEEQMKVLREIRRLLKPGGAFLIDYMNPVYVKNTLVLCSEREEDGHHIVEERSIKNGFVIKDIRISSGSEEPRIYHERVKLYEEERLRFMLDKAGLQVDEVHGDYDERDYDPEGSRRMIFAGTRPN
ncbi:methyltransferase domain-containing protein [Paenibacillus sp. JX-17]|uniref:Methyltransferase domain-containing protein n=1 Tax=Paenibacillus lacisoli TaxID=3064525 RepID=A0ABT9CCE3_9BACL|nr:methyltransferase domain-containing protein [Paenibacillus sp. JX-17]MDO7906932.1 methyltransferase domain-containing protein [Paenibacillus sp. JX-17]